MSWRIKYQLLSGMLFIALGIMIFIRGQGYIHLLSAGLFAVLLTAFGVYRIALFVRLAKTGSGNKP